MIKIHGLWKRFGKLQVLAGMDLEIRDGETLVILGPSGIGKSVLLKHIIGLIKPDAGTVDVDNTRITDLEGPELFKAVQNMGMLFQGGALFDSMSVEDNVAFYLRQHGDPDTKRKHSKAEITDRVSHALELVGLQGTQKKMPSELSGGMRKRAALARLVVYRPKIVLYDEPTTGLDPIIAMQINELIVKTKEELKATSIVVTHDMFSALYVGDRLALIRDGKIAQIGDPDTFLKIDDPLIKFLYCTISQDPRKLKEKNHHG
ncbi:MAG: ATP-binding cassette domain-containing protein [Verrucomicrobia bacterium]|nr:ATP-binding cassette domain-containing protein [Verrucomicrobiota bacterium]